MIIMVAKVSTATVAQFKFSIDEVAVLESTYELLDVIHSTLNDGDVIINRETGECITWHEFARVKGILSGLLENSGGEWDVREE